MATAFGSYFDTATNRFGIDFVAIENNAFGIDPFPFVPLPSAVANYDFNFYTANSPVIANQVSGVIGDATIHEENNNTYDTTNPANKFLYIYGPNINPSPTGGMTTPSIANVYSAEMWVRLDQVVGYGTYFVDFRTGLGNGYIIGASSGDGAVGPDWENETIYYNTAGETLTAISNPVARIYNTGWYQVVLVRSTPFTDDMSFFCRLSQQQGCPLGVADVRIYDVALTAQQVKDLYNLKCSRYGLAPV
jgi:hypothetical protein